MLPVLSATAVREADAWTIEHERIPSWELMERAGSACADRIAELITGGHFGEPSKTAVLVLAGAGNNGGDGLVIARLLKQRGLDVTVFHAMHGSRSSPDNAKNLGIAIEVGVEITEIEEGADVESLFRECAPTVIIDALLGSGTRGGLTGTLVDLVEQADRSRVPIIAVDIPSGLSPDPTVAVGATIHASLTLSLELPKLPFFFPESAANVGEFEIVPIGLDRDFIASRPCDHFLVEPGDVKALLAPRPRFAHKGHFGHALLMGGSEGMMGAMVLATNAALRSGAGRVSVDVDDGVRGLIHSAAPEATCVRTGDRIGASSVEYTALGIGPGMGRNERTRIYLKGVIQTAQRPVVIDADALNVLAEEPTWSAFLPQGTVLTPHPKEFDRLFGSSSSTAYERLERARECARKWRCHIVLKGAFTATCTPAGQVFFNPTGNPGMAKGGSGDVLTGLLTGLLAQGYPTTAACLLSVYLHGLAGDLAAAQLGMDGMVAGDIVSHLPKAWKVLRS
jgi:NAD(P)H-hydrate epimerase